MYAGNAALYFLLHRRAVRTLLRAEGDPSLFSFFSSPSPLSLVQAAAAVHSTLQTNDSAKLRATMC